MLEVSLEDPPDETWPSLSQGHGNILGFLNSAWYIATFQKVGEPKAVLCSVLPVQVRTQS